MRAKFIFLFGLALAACAGPEQSGRPIETDRLVLKHYLSGGTGCYDRVAKYNPELDRDAIYAKCECVRDTFIDNLDPRLASYLAVDPYARIGDKTHRAPRWVDELATTNMIPAGREAHNACGVKWGE